MTKKTLDISDVELAKRVKEIKGVASKEDFEMILNHLVPAENRDNINRIISGLSQEDEFALLCKMLECCSSITPLNQTPITNTDEITPDFQATFHPGSFLSRVSRAEASPFNCMIEVKSTDKLKFKCSRKDIDRRRRYAARFNLPLLYAIRFTSVTDHAFWVMVSADDLFDKNRLDTSAYVDSIGQLLFDNYSILTNNTYTFVRRYSTHKTGIGESHEKLGNLQSVELISQDGKSYKPGPHDSLILAMMYNLFNSASSYTETYNGESVIYSGFRFMNFLTLMDTVYYLNNIITDGEGNKYYDPVRAIANMDSATNPTMIIRRSIVEDVIRRTNLSCENFFFYGILGDHQKRIDKLLHLKGMDVSDILKSQLKT